MKNWIGRIFLLLLFVTTGLQAQPEVPVEKWTGRTIMLIGAHPDDDTYAQGTMAMLEDHGNEIWIVILTTGNVGTLDPKLSKTDLARIRRQEELAALGELGVPEDHYINLGYDDGMLEFQDRKEIVERLVRKIREYRPDVLLAFDTGPEYMRWHKSDHRAAAFFAADATRAAMWRLLFEGQIIQDGLKAYQIPEFLFFDTPKPNTWVDVNPYVEQKVRAGMKYVSQWGPGWKEYKGPNLSPTEAKEMEARIRARLTMRDGKAVEGFRYYKGLPDGMGK
jgi:LmbE family N-acetylglucosaminyl deacetylase